MPRSYKAVIEIKDYWDEGEPSPDDMQGILNQAFEYQDGVSAKVIGEVAVTEFVED